MRTLDFVENETLRRDLPPFKVGDTVAVHVKVREGDKERIQIFQGLVIGRKGGGDFHGSKDFEWCWGRAHLSRPVAPGHEDRHQGARLRSTREALLPARPHGQEGTAAQQGS